MNRNQQMISMASRGYSYAEIGRQFGVCRETVRLACKDVIGRRNKVSVEDGVDVARVLALRRDGLSHVAIAERTGVGRWTVARLCHRHGMKVDKETYTDRQRESAVELVRAGCTYGEAAATLGMTRNAVAGAVHRAKQASLP